MAMFKAFKPEAMNKIAKAMGYSGDMGQFQSYIEQDPARQARMQQFTNAAVQMARGGVVKMQEGGTPKNVQEAAVQRMFTPGLPEGGVTVAATTPSEAGQYIDPRVGGITGGAAVPTAMATTTQAAPVQEEQAAQMQAAQAAPAVDAAVQATQAAQGTVDPRAQVTAAQQTASSVGNVTAAQGNAVLIDNPVQRQIQQGELISGAADAQTAAQFTEQVQAAEATPSTQATVQGQLASLTANFDAANPPAWAAGALRSATQQMAARGLGGLVVSLGKQLYRPPLSRLFLLHKLMHLRLHSLSPRTCLTDNNVPCFLHSNVQSLWVWSLRRSFRLVCRTPLKLVM